MNKAHYIRKRQLFAVIVVVITGISPMTCGCGDQPYELAPVSGRVTIDGQPTAGIHISFQPRASDMDNPNPGPGSYGVTDEQGQFQMTAIGVNKPGAVLGKHIVRMVPHNSANVIVERPLASNIRLPKYSMDGTLQFDVPKGGTTEANFDLRLR